MLDEININSGDFMALFLSVAVVLFVLGMVVGVFRR